MVNEVIRKGERFISEKFIIKALANNSGVDVGSIDLDELLSELNIIKTDVLEELE